MDFKYLKGWGKRAFEKTGGRGKFLKFLFEPPINKNDVGFEFHGHTIGSDGIRDAKMVGHEAQANKVKKLAFTDHDTVKTLDELFEGKTDLADFSGEFVNGVEITARLGGKCIEVLVYDFDYKKLKQLSNSHDFPFLDRKFKLERIIKLIKQRIDIVNNLGLTDEPLSLNDFVSLEVENSKGVIQKIPLSKLGIDSSAVIDFNVEPMQIREKISLRNDTFNVNYDYFNSKLYEYIKNSKRGSDFLKEYAVGNKKSITSFAEFNRFMIQRSDSPLFVDDKEFWPTVSQIAGFAKQVGGISILAHPYGYGNLDVSAESLMEEAVRAGVDGIECMHGFNEPDEIEKIYKFCYERDLLITAGSDTHDFYSMQGNLTEFGRFPSQGVKSKFEDNQLEDAKISTYNLHYFGSGAWRGEKTFDVDNEFNYQK